MKTLRNRILFSFIGSLLILSMSGCNEKGEVDSIISTQYHYVNETEYQIDMEIFNAKSELIKVGEVLPKDTLSFSIVAEGGAGPFQFSDTKGFGDSICLAFDDSRYLSFRQDYDSIFFEKAYNKVKVSDRAYNMYYFLTNELFEKAEEIK